MTPTPTPTPFYVDVSAVLGDIWAFFLVVFLFCIVLAALSRTISSFRSM